MCVQWYYCRDHTCKTDRYCSHKCADTAWEQYHQPLCGYDMKQLYAHVEKGVTGSSKFPLLEVKLSGTILTRLLPVLEKEIPKRLQAIRVLNQSVVEGSDNDPAVIAELIA